MPIFPVLESEALVQQGDKTRLDGSKSYLSGAGNLAAWKIQPEAGAPLIDVSTTEYLDWQYDFTLDVVEDENDRIDFKEGSTSFVAQLTEATYTLDTLATEIAARMTASGGQTYSAAVVGRKIVISAASAFALLGATGANASMSVLPEIQFAADTKANISQTSVDTIDTFFKTVTLQVTDDAIVPNTVTITKKIEVISEAGDGLFSTDDKIRKHEPLILRYVPDGRATFKDVHRRAQALMMAWLDEQGYIDDFGIKFTAKRIKDISEVTEWSAAMVLRLIFEGMANSKEDEFKDKAKTYERQETFFRNRAVLRIDLNEDGEVQLGEQVSVQDCIVVRR